MKLIIDSSSDVCTHWPRPVRSRAISAASTPLREDRAGGGVGDRDADARRSGARRAGDAHHAAEALRDLVDTRTLRVRTVLTEARDARVDEPRVHAPRACRGRCAAGASPPGGSSRRARRRARRGAAAPRARRRSRDRRSRNACCGGGSRRRTRRTRTRSRRVGGHTCTTSAPKSASWRTHVGPARATARSTTRMPSSGPSSTRLTGGDRRDTGDHHDEAEHHVGDGAPDRRLRELALLRSGSPGCGPGYPGGPGPRWWRSTRSASRRTAEQRPQVRDEQRGADRGEQLPQDLVVVHALIVRRASSAVPFGLGSDARLPDHEREDHDHQDVEERAVAPRAGRAPRARRPAAADRAARAAGGGPASTSSRISTPMRFTAGSSTPCDTPMPTM